MKISEQAQAANAEIAKSAADEASELLPARVSNNGGAAFYLDSRQFGQAYKAAVLLSQAGEMVPTHFRGSWQKCFIALELASRFDMSPFMVMQRTYIVHGRPGLESKLKIALANRRAPIRGGIQFAPLKKDRDGKIVSCTAFAIRADNGERAEFTVDRDMVRAEGWDQPKGEKRLPSKWVTMPELMYRYRAASMLIDTHWPDVVLGMQTPEEIEDSQEPPQPLDEPQSAPAIEAELVDDQDVPDTMLTATQAAAPADAPAEDGAAESRRKRLGEILLFADDVGLTESEIKALLFELDIRTTDARSMTAERLDRLAERVSYLADELSK